MPSFLTLLLPCLEEVSKPQDAEKAAEAGKSQESDAKAETS